MREDVGLLPAKEMLTESRAYTRSTISGRESLASGACAGETSAKHTVPLPHNCTALRPHVRVLSSSLFGSWTPSKILSYLGVGEVTGLIDDCPAEGKRASCESTVPCWRA